MISGFNIFLPVHYANFLLFWPQESIQIKTQQEEAIKSHQTLPEFQGIKMNLTVEDLEEAGYHNDRTPWTQREDSLLIKLGAKNDMTWIQIAEKIPNRTAKMCYSRFRRIANQTKSRWTAKEDQKIKQLVELYGQRWSKISQHLPGRPAKQLQQHYNYCLKPQINKSEWTIDQDMLLIQLLEKYGKNWTYLEQNMNGRTQHQIKNRYFGRLKKLQERKESKARSSANSQPQSS